MKRREFLTNSATTAGVFSSTAILAACGSLNTSAPKMTSVLASDTVLNGVAVSRQGRVFVSFPRWGKQQEHSVAEVMPSGQLRAYPDARWNEWDKSLPVADRFVLAHSVFIDSEDQLWVVDDGSPYFEPFIPGSVKLVQFDLATDKIVRTIVLQPGMLPPAALLGHLRRDGDLVFVTESRGRAIIVIDLKTGVQRRVLGTHPSTAADPTIVPRIDGVDWLMPHNGKPMVVHVNLLEISQDRKWLYYCPLFGPTLHRVPLTAIKDPTLSEADINRLVEPVCAIPPVAGLIRDGRGGFYLCSITQNSILRLTPDNRLVTVIQDNRLSFPNAPALTPDGSLYVPCSQVQRLPMFYKDGVSRVQGKFRLYKIEGAV